MPKTAEPSTRTGYIFGLFDSHDQLIDQTSIDEFDENFAWELFDSFADALDDDNFSLVMQFLQTQLPNVDQVIITAHHSVTVPGAYRIAL